MPKIFISYRRADSTVYADDIYRRLVEQFGEHSVFFDTEEIDLGDKFAEIIDERVAKCDVLLAIIGPKWLAIEDAKGCRRLDQPDDYVRHELDVALRRNVSVIPVIVGGARIPRKEELPEILAGLSDRKVLEVSDARLDQDIERLIAKLARYETRRQLNLRDKLRKVAWVVVPATALVFFFAAFVGLLDYLTLDTKIETYTITLGSLFKKRLPSDEIAIVAINKDTERHFNKPFDRAWRHEHARLIELLSGSGAKAVIFDIILKDTSPHDGELVAAIESARQKGTAVFFGTVGAPATIRW